MKNYEKLNSKYHLTSIPKSLFWVEFKTNCAAVRRRRLMVVRPMLNIMILMLDSGTRVTGQFTSEIFIEVQIDDSTEPHINSNSVDRFDTSP